MARAYSEDLRIRIVKAYEQGLGSIREIAQQFQVGKPSSVSCYKDGKSKEV
jgi:transposase